MLHNMNAIAPRSLSERAVVSPLRLPSFIPLHPWPPPPPPQGRRGRGVILVWASGNGGGDADDNCACDGYASSPFTLSVGSVDQDGRMPWYGEICASTLAVTYTVGHPNNVVSNSVIARCQQGDQWRRHGGGGGKRGNLPPPPQPPIGHPVRSMQIRGDFWVRKNGGRFTGFAPKFYMHRRYGGRSLVLRLRKRGSCGSCWRSYSGRP